ncbi:type II secretion system F family protein [Sulfuriflexus sp.]|uniref:type II secretion system F family protein n=1 Tax=Sulfuriflexus sp. TaxID=2015443 RepID=UPI0028CD140A|nr:type II secretion system F family protein [Sulfuriflexus sp.]MDT8403032.1 type II secretion system F family protein [Sulfuriflexus sp.]
MTDLIGFTESVAAGKLGYMALLLVFLSTALMFYAILQWLMGGKNPVQRRLESISEKQGEHVPHQEGEFNVHWVEPLAKVLLPKQGWKRSNLKTKLVRAGYRHPGALNVFVSIKILLAILLPLIIVLLFLILSPALITTRTNVLALLVLIAIIGFYLPEMILSRRVSLRQLTFVEGFPDAMDMLVVCVESGLGLDAAVQRVGLEMGGSHPQLADEFNLLSLELRAGKSREEALRSLADRTGVDEVRSLTTLLIQAEHFGTSVATALNEHSKEMRIKRVQNAREKAAKLAVKLIFPIMFFIFPALFLIVLGPAMVRIYKGFFVAFGG